MLGSQACASPLVVIIIVVILKLQWPGLQCRGAQGRSSQSGAPKKTGGMDGKLIGLRGWEGTAGEAKARSFAEQWRINHRL